MASHDVPVTHRPEPPLSRIAGGVTLICALAAALCMLASTASGRPTDAHAAGILSGLATAHLHLVKAEGSTLLEEGPVSGALTGSVKAKLKTGASFAGSFTIHTRSGSISGNGHAKPHGAGRYQSFRGSFIATGGTGRYARIHGTAELYGTFDVRTDKTVIQTTGGRLYY